MEDRWLRVEKAGNGWTPITPESGSILHSVSQMGDGRISPCNATFRVESYIQKAIASMFN